MLLRVPGEHLHRCTSDVAIGRVGHTCHPSLQSVPGGTGWEAVSVHGTDHPTVLLINQPSMPSLVFISFSRKRVN